MEKFIKIFKALSDETRLRIYLLLVREELCVCELENILEMEQSRISHSLKILKNAELVNSKREGRWMLYSVNLKVLKSKIVRGVIDELALPASDLKNLKRCKKERVRQRCK